MKRRVLFWGVLLATLAFLAIATQRSNADNNAQVTGRSKTVEIQATEYVWELVSNKDGAVICQIIVEHPNRPSNDEAIQVCGDQIFPPFATPTPLGTPPPKTPVPRETPFDLSDFFSKVTWRLAGTREFTRTVKVPIPELVTNFSIPPGQQQPPFLAILSAYEPVYGQRITGISGILNGIEFTCSGNRCNLPITTDSTVEFWATSSLGDESRHVQAALRIVRNADNTSTLELVSLVPIVLFQDSCALTWGTPRINVPVWADFPASPEDLNTQKPYQYLAAQLLAAGLAPEAKDCPGGGMWAGGAPNSCGLEKSTPAVINWQNQFDVVLWETGRTVGIPPRLLKVMLEQESQFWPGNSRYGLFEYGLGQLSQSGADVALRWDNDLFASVCNGLLYDCSVVYARLPYYLQATLRGGMVRSLNAECPTCKNGIDLSKAYDSVPVFARTLRSNCRQVKYLLDTRAMKADYQDLWRFTFVSYHSGYQCLAEALDYTKFNEQPADWLHVSAFLSCPGSQLYANNLWKSLLDFDTYRIKPENRGASPTALPTFLPTPSVPTATPTPTPILAMSHIRVVVYVDQNNNNYPDPNEMAEGVKVTVNFPDGQVRNATTVNGNAIIDLTGRPVDEEVLVILPELYRTQQVRVIRDGEIPVVFRLEQPVVPPGLP